MAEETIEQYRERMRRTSKVSKSQLVKDMPGTNTITGYFSTWTRLEKKEGMKELKEPDVVTATIKKPGQNQGKSMYTISANVILSEITLGDRVVQEPDGTYLVRCSVSYEEKNKAEIETYIRTNMVSDLYDPATDTIHQEIWVPFSPNNHISVKITYYEAGDVEKYKALDPVTGLPKIRITVPVTLTGCSAQIYLKLAENSKRTGADRWSLSRYPSFKCGSMSPVLGGKASQSLVDLYHHTCPKDAVQLVPMLDIYSGIAQPPSVAVMWLDQTGTFTTDQVDRVSLDEIGSDAYKKLLFHKTHPKFQTTVREVQFGTRKSYLATFVGWKEICEKSGLNCTPSLADPSTCAFTEIMAAHHFSGYIIGAYNKAATMQYSANNQQELATKSPDDVDGVYEFRITDLVIDWKDTLTHRGIEISRECFIKTFRDANANKKGEEVRFKESILADQTREYWIKSPQRGEDYSNPVTINGAESEVIPCGSADCPTVSSRDFGTNLQRPNARFFALTSVYALPEDRTSTASGDALFSYQLATITKLYYSLFIIQPTTDSASKQHIN